MLALLAIVILLLFFMSVGAPPLTLGAILVGVLFVGFWVFVLKVLIGFGQWLIGEPPLRRPHRTKVTLPGPPVRYVTSSHMCADPRCGRVNVPEARFCAQCGRPLDSAPRRADGRAA